MRRLVRLFFLLLLVCVTIAPLSFRIAASLRETETRQAVTPSEGRLIQTALGEIYLEETGPVDGPPVLLAHGTAAWSRLWGDTSRALANEGYRAIAFDMPPFGFSERAADADYSRSKQAKRLLALVDALENKPVLVAHSFGAGPATEAAMQRPEAFAGLVLVDGAVGLGSHNLSAELPLPLRPIWLRKTILSLTATNPLMTTTLLKQLIHRKKTATPEVAEMLHRPGRIEGSTDALARWLPSLLLPPKEARSTRASHYQELTLSTALIWGKQDTITPLEQAITLQSLIPDAQLEVLEDVGHIPQLEAPEAFNQALIKVLNSAGFMPN